MVSEPFPQSLLAGAPSRDQWLAAGATRRELAGPLWSRLRRGRYAWSPEGENVTAMLRRLGDLAPPDGCLGGWAAAHLLGAADLDGVAAAGVRLPVLMCMPRRQTSRHLPPEVRVWRSDLGPADVVRVRGTPVSAPARTGFDLARLSPAFGGGGRGAFDETEALVALEALLRTGTTTLDEIGAYAADHPRKAGARQARRVLQQAMPGVRSCQETRFRRLWTVDAGLPQPMVNALVADDHGRIVAEVDLLDVDAGLAGEYDGGDHASAGRRAKDHARAQHLEALGLGVVRVAAPDLSEFRRRTVQRLQALYHRGLARDGRADRWHLAHPGRCLRP